MKRIIAILMAAALMLSMAACGGGGIIGYDFTATRVANVHASAVAFLPLILGGFTPLGAVFCKIFLLFVIFFDRFNVKFRIAVFASHILRKTVKLQRSTAVGTFKLNVFRHILLLFYNVGFVKTVTALGAELGRILGVLGLPATLIATIKRCIGRLLLTALVTEFA